MIFILLLILVDNAVGSLLSIMVRFSIGGDTARNEYISHRLDRDILIFGSSRGIYHYDPRIIADSLGLSCYNCANDGMGILLFYPRYEMVVERYVPKIILYDVFSDFDLENIGDNHTYMNWQRLYYDHNAVKEVFRDIDPNEHWKMLSKMYRFNGKILQILGDNIINTHEEYDGYRPQSGVMSYEPLSSKDVGYKISYDSLKIKYIEKFIKSCKKNGTKIYFIISPFYKGLKNVPKIYRPVIDLTNKYDIPFIDFSNYPDISDDKNYFVDSHHMNLVGSERFSKMIIHEIRKTLK